jgi:nitrous oxidase accessory protein
MFSNHDKYLGNTFSNNGAGVAVMFSRNIEMTNNTFELNWGTASYGLLLKEIYDGKIIKNKFLYNTIGIYGEGANRIEIMENEFMGNGWALKILGSCADNTISKNNFISNTFDLSTNNSRNYNNYDGNYWSDYSGYDLNKDGRGDIPYRPMKLFSYLVSRVEPSIVLLRSFFIDIIDFAEKVTPMFTPPTLVDSEPLMKPWKNVADN